MSRNVRFAVDLFPQISGMKSAKKRKRNKKRDNDVDAFKYLNTWLHGDDETKDSAIPSFRTVDLQVERSHDELVIELHSHTTCSDGKLSPLQLIDLAEKHSVKILSLTDHDTMSGVRGCMEAGAKHGIKVIPGVEISTYVLSKCSKQQSVHILAYFKNASSPAMAELEQCLKEIRDGRNIRAKSMVDKLCGLGKPISFSRVLQLAGEGTAPGRPHVARALLEAGHVSTMNEAFRSLIGDNGPAYSEGTEIPAEDAVKMIRDAGGVSVFAHPWTVPDYEAVATKLTSVGLNGIEVYKGSTKDQGCVELAQRLNLLRLGGSDFHDRGGPGDATLGSCRIPTPIIALFVKLLHSNWNAANAS